MGEHDARLDRAERAGPPTYRDKLTERFAEGFRVKEFHAIEKQAKRRLDILLSATSREDLMRLPSNRFEALGGDRHGQFSIRINDRWRICFEWPSGANGPSEIEIVDYH